MPKPNKVIGIIPARFNSSRFPGKPLALIQGTSLIQRTYENALLTKSLDQLIVATDDQRIFEHVKSFGGEVLMTPPCHTGTERAAAAVKNYSLEADIIINIQGDEPGINPSIIDLLVEKMREKGDSLMITPVTPIGDPLLVSSPSIVKCVFDRNFRALYFSRSPIPYHRNGPKSFFRHWGIYCFRKEFLLHYATLSATPLQQAEDLEQLKILETGYPLHVCVVEEEGMGIDTPEDLLKFEELLCKKNSSLLQAALPPL